MAVTDEAIARIRDMLLSGALRPGDRLPPEKQLSEMLGVSRNSLREAVRALELIRVLDVRRGDGTFVTDLDPGGLLEAMSFVVDVHGGDTLIEVFDVRRILEAESSARAALRMSPEVVAELRSLTASVERSSDINALVRHDMEFHSLIARTGGNNYLAGLLDALGSQTVRARVWRGLTEANAVERTLREHEQIVDALADGDAELVRALVTVHVSGVQRWLRRTKLE